MHRGQQPFRAVHCCLWPGQQHRPQIFPLPPPLPHTRISLCTASLHSSKTSCGCIHLVVPALPLSLPCTADSPSQQQLKKARYGGIGKQDFLRGWEVREESREGCGGGAVKDQQHGEGQRRGLCHAHLCCWFTPPPPPPQLDPIA